MMMMHDCIDGMDEPMYGFVTELDLVDDAPCILDTTCDANGNKIEGSIDQNNLTPVRNYPLRARSDSGSQDYYQRGWYYYYANVNRQTGEDFASNGPPRCRARRDPSNACRTSG